jgi:hypothetical protein
VCVCVCEEKKRKEEEKKKQEGIHTKRIMFSIDKCDDAVDFVVVVARSL